MSPGPHGSAADIAAALGAREVGEVRRLPGGASRETFAFEADGRPLILQRARPGAMRQAGMATEAR
ncbi:MAG: phosphotransferase family protein, partial [Acidimicrobiales bacterium]